MYQDYSNTLQEDPYVRYINRWNLKKMYPHQKLSKPEKPIVYWLENTIPTEFRDAIREGILAWNEAFEAIGFKDAIVVKQMPDDAKWDPADIRYSTIRWLVQPGSGIAVGPSRANPYTGEIYDADIRISADFIRFFYTEFGEFLDPMTSDSYDGYIQSIEEEDFFDNHDCNYAKNMMHEMAFAWYSSFELLNIPQVDKKKILFYNNLESIPDSDGNSVMDNTLIVWGSEMANGWHGYLNYCPVLIGGSWHFNTGRYMYWPHETPVQLLAPQGYTQVSGKPHQHLLTSVSQAMGIDTNQFGITKVETRNGARLDLTGPLPGLT